MKRKIFIALIATGLTMPAFAQHDHHMPAETPAAKQDTVKRNRLKTSPNLLPVNIPVTGCRA
jgi:hypothetical protein